MRTHLAIFFADQGDVAVLKIGCTGNSQQWPKKIASLKAMTMGIAGKIVRSKMFPLKSAKGNDEVIIKS